MMRNIKIGRPVLVISVIHPKMRQRITTKRERSISQHRVLSLSSTPNVPIRAAISGSNLFPDRPGVASQLVPALVADRLRTSVQPHDGDSDKNEGDGGNELPREKEGTGDVGRQGDFQKRSRTKMLAENTRNGTGRTKNMACTPKHDRSGEVLAEGK